MYRGITAVASVTMALIFTGPANAGSQVCGNYVFGGAFPTLWAAQQKADTLGAMALDLRRSNSPNNHKKLFVVAEGPYDSVQQAKNLAKNWRNRGVKGAYAANRCFTGD